MFFISDIQTDKPSKFETALQEKVYATLMKLHIPFERVDTDEAITMEDCTAIEEKLDMKMVKTLLLCNRHQTMFYLFITCGNKPFRSKECSAALGVPRLSFAPAEKMRELLGTEIGAATVFSALLDSAKDVQLVIDKAVLKEESFGCSDGTTRGFMKIKTADIQQTLLPFTKRMVRFAEV